MLLGNTVLKTYFASAKTQFVDAQAGFCWFTIPRTPYLLAAKEGLDLVHLSKPLAQVKFNRFEFK